MIKKQIGTAALSKSDIPYLRAYAWKLTRGAFTFPPFVPAIEYQEPVRNPYRRRRCSIDFTNDSRSTDFGRPKTIYWTEFGYTNPDKVTTGVDPVVHADTLVSAQVAGPSSATVPEPQDEAPRRWIFDPAWPQVGWTGWPPILVPLETVTEDEMIEYLSFLMSTRGGDNRVVMVKESPDIGEIIRKYDLYTTSNEYSLEGHPLGGDLATFDLKRPHRSGRCTCRFAHV